MAAPATDWTLIRITGHLRDWSANELTGTITFTPNVDHAESDATNMMVLPSTLTGTFVAGIMKDAALNPYMDIPATTDPDIQPSGWTYHMVIATPLKTIAWDVSIPFDAAGGTLDLTDLTPVTPATPVVGAGAATQWTSGTGSPEGAVTGAIGDIWSRTDGAAGTTLYTKQSGTGNTGWAPLVPNGRTITAGSGLTGGGDFSADRTLAASYGTPGASAVGDTAAAGSATTVPHSDHTHAREGFGAVTAAAIGAASANGTATTVSHSDHNHGLPASAVADVTGLTAALAAKAPLASPALTGTPTAPTATAADNSTKIATTAYADNGLATKAATSHTHAEADVTSLTTDLGLKAPLASPALTGTPTTPTAAPGTNTTQLASTAYVTAADVAERTATATLTGKTLTSPVINTPTGIVKGDVGLGNVDNTSNATERAATATLTNKTLTSPVINTPTGIVKGDVGLGNVDNTSDATERAATATLTNKSISGATNTLTAIPESAVTNLTTDLAAKAATATQVIAGTGLTGGGTLAADRTLTVAYGATSSTATVGNDYRLTDRRCGQAITAGGEWVTDKRFFVASATPQTSGRLQISYVVATVTETINTISLWTSGTAGATLTLVRYVVFTVDGSGNLSAPVASTTSDTALLTTTNAKHSKALSSAWSKTAGTLYAVGFLITGTTMPTLFSDQALGAQVGSDIRFVEPTYNSYITGLSDIPAGTTTRASLVASRQSGFIEMTP